MIESLESRRLLSTNVLTFHNDNASTGANTTETQLTPSNVKTGSFGKLFATTLDGQVYAQPLTVSGVTIGAGVNTSSGAAGLNNVVFAATQNDTLYAIDSTAGGGGRILWQRSFLNTSNPGGDQNSTLGATSITVISNNDVGSPDINPTIGITGTPVIDAVNNLLYVVVKTRETIGGNIHFVQRLHAINLSNGTDAVAPFLIGDTTNGNSNNTAIYTYGTGDGSVTDPYNGTGRSVVQFNALHDAQRGALSLVNGTLYIPWASHGDNGPYHGWVAAWNVSNLSSNGFKLAGVLCTSPNDGESGIWEGGGHLVFESDGSAFYFQTGNGTGGAPTVGANGFPTNANYNEALVKATLDPSTSPANQNSNGWGLKIVDYFIPYNVVSLDGADSDFGSGGPVLLPDSAGIPNHQHLIVVGGKEGKLYVLDRNNLGHFNSAGDSALDDVTNASGNNTPAVTVNGTLNTPAYYNGHLYALGGYNGRAVAFTISSTGQLTPSSQTSIQSFGYLPSSPSISANGSINGIVWLTDRNLNQVHAYDANSFSTELWNSGQAAGGADNVGAVVKFATPTISNGEVFIGTYSGIVVYGLTPPASSAPAAPVLTATALSGSSINLTWTDSSTVPNTASTYLIEQSTDNITFKQITSAPAGATALAIGGLVPQTKYYFRIRGANGVGNSQYSNVVNATTTSQTATIDFSGGFASAAGRISTNGAAAVAGSNLVLTNGQSFQAGSSFYSTAVDITKFTSQFYFQLSAGGGTADGFTFTLQNAGTTALGSVGSGLGYGAATTGGAGGINNSIAIKFDLYNNNGEGSNSTGLYTNGAAPTNVNSVDLTSTGLDLHSGDIFLASMTYDGTNLVVTLKDTTLGSTATQTYPIQIASVIGSSTAFAGFTGGTGGATATQSILSWTYSSGSSASTSPNAPSGLGATPATATSVNLNWTNTSSNQTGFHLDRATDSGFTQNFITETLASNADPFTDVTSGLAPGSTFYYRIRAFNSAGDSASSNTASVTIPLAPPKPTNQTVKNVTAGQIDISWTDNAGHLANGYYILRAANHGSFSTVATLPPTSRTAPSEYDWSDTNLSPGTYYEYHIEAYNTSGNNDFAGVNATTLPAAPTAVAATQGSAVINLSWAAPAGAVSYNIYRGASAGTESATRFASTTTPGYADTSVTNGTTYFYKVTAVNANAAYVPPLPSEGAASSEASATAGATSTAPGKLTGAVIGTAGSYDGVSTIANAFDGNTNTFFDAPTANNDWAGLNLGSPQTVAQIKYAPRVGFEYRMIGGVFQGSNDPSFSTGVTTLYTITSTPADGFNTVQVTAGGAYQYVRYLAPAGAYGNIAELEFDGTSTVTPPPPPTTGKLTGTVIGTPGSYDGVSTIANAFDGNTNTFFDAPNANNDWAGLNLGSPQTVAQIKYAPRAGFEYRMVGGVFQGSNDPSFSTGVTTLYTIAATPADGINTVQVNASAAYQYVRYLAPAGAYGNVAELEFDGTSTATPPPPPPTTGKLTGTVIGTPGSYDGFSTIANAFDGNTNTFFDAPTGNNDWVGLDLGATHTITQIKYAPRTGFEYRMVGGVFQASNDPTFSTGIATLYTITSTPADGLNTIQVNSATPYRYVRYLAPAGAYGNVAELEFDGT